MDKKQALEILKALTYRADFSFVMEENHSHSCDPDTYRKITEAQNDLSFKAYQLETFIEENFPE